MKRYEVRKIVKAGSIDEAIKKEKKTSVEYVVMIDDDDEEIEEVEDIHFGFQCRK